MIKFENVSFGFPTKDLYDNISFTIEKGDHAVLIGSNGCGKSSLVRLMMDKDEFTYDGTIKVEENCRMGYVSQFVKHESLEMTSYDFLAAPFLKMLADFDAVCAKMGDDTFDQDKVNEEYQKLMDEMEAIDAYNYDTNIRKQLAAVGLSEITDSTVAVLSGGEYKLLYIMRSMLQKPQLLIMDEPDVFLDFGNLVSLTKLINTYDGTLLAITHSRLLLNQCFDKVLDIENMGLREFPGNFAEYNTWILDTKIDLFEHCHNFDEFIAIQEELVKKIRKRAEGIAEPRLGRQLGARATYLERLRKMRGDDPFLEEHHHEFAFHVPGEEVEAEPEETGVKLTMVNGLFRLEDANVVASDSVTADNTASSDAVVMGADSELSADESAENTEPQHEPVVVTLENYALSFDRELLSDVNFTLQPGEKLAIIGENGTGKSSMLKDIYAMLEESHPGAAGYFRQIITEEDGSTLSGGERNLAVLDELSSEPKDVLLLDEPTSHLDVYAQIALEQAIRDYKGTVVLVSHDLFAVTGCADRILILENGGAREMSNRAYRKSIYKNYFSSDIFEAERKRIETEIRVSNLIRAKKFEDARTVLQG